MKTTTSRPQVIGLCRFSYPGIGGFQVEHPTLQARIGYLFSAERMEDRFRQFEAITLPGLRAQTEPEFELLVLVGDAMPPRYRARLAEMLENIPQARIIARPPGPHRKVMQGVINAARDMSRPSLQFRQDDDDAVAVDFIERLRLVAEDCSALRTAHRHVAIDFNRGYVAEPGPEGMRVAPVTEPLWAVALALATAPGGEQTIMNFAHHKLSRFMPTISIPDAAMFVRGHNAFNDSRQGAKARAFPLAPVDPKQKNQFRRRFAIDCERVRMVFGAVEDPVA